MTDRLEELRRDHRDVRSSLRATVAQTRRIRDRFKDLLPLKRSNPNVDVPPLLLVAEGLIVSHQAAKIDNDGYTLDLIEDALFHVGKRLAKECPAANSQGDG